ncbi:hypothetical protein T265_11804 [Opisthorchis viverrini]|uniref:Hemoglobinase n=1 Tax=Opisthorchis viverrini TaxID=6198 RepID=A0A074Z856_OPIVI|nr:hypothetical protein T265_11804 [Opisthorchis viverrini]KER19420.1 hypothetical protein T265_11804 [Opisthorchis viverrini]
MIPLEFRYLGSAAALINFAERHMKLRVSRDTMRRCSLLLAFLFCIDHVAYLDSVSVHNWPSVFNNQPSKNWVVLVAGTNTWENYRHQADVYHAYQVVRKNKVPPENIITLAYDDIANNPRNPFKGQVFNHYNHRDVYKGVVIDYRGKDVTRDNFMKVLKGDKKHEANEKKVLESGPDDNVFIFYSGHGGSSYIGLLGEYLYAIELNDTLAYMHSKKKFNKLVLYMESCNSGSMFKDVLPSNMGIYVTTSAMEDEASCAVFCFDSKIDVCMANEYPYEWITDSEQNDIKKRTLKEQYTAVRRKTLLSHVMKYGDMAHLLSKFRRLMEAETEEELEAAWRKLHRAIQLGHIVKETFRNIIMDVTTHHEPTIKGLSKRDELIVSVHNWPSVFNNQPSKNWVVLVAGTNTWENYRHQAKMKYTERLMTACTMISDNRADVENLSVKLTSVSPIEIIRGLHVTSTDGTWCLPLTMQGAQTLSPAQLKVQFISAMGSLFHQRVSLDALMALIYI